MVKANTVQGHINKSQECKKRNNFPIVLATGQSLVRALFLVLVSTTKKDMVNLEKVQRRTTKMIKGLKKKPKRKKNFSRDYYYSREEKI